MIHDLGWNKYLYKWPTLNDLILRTLVQYFPRPILYDYIVNTFVCIYLGQHVFYWWFYKISVFFISSIFFIS